MTISITIAHTKTDAENEAQIQALLGLVDTIGTEVTWEEPDVDEEGNQLETTHTETATIYHYQFKNVPQEHTILFFQAVPYGVMKPASYGLLLQAQGCGGVLYGPGDAQRGLTRFFNWGLKRGIDRGGDIAIFLTDPADLTATKLRSALADLKENSGLVERTWGRIATKKALLQIGQLKEDRTLAQAITDYKSRLTAGGLE
jgi:hypothetical protein